jgi:exopolysaccharide production protein ExoZ
MVVYGHATLPAIHVTGSSGSIPLGLTKIGPVGVDIFFVVSGFIITRIAPGRTPSEFIWARFTRIVPLYLLFAAPLFFANRAEFGWREALATFLLWPATDQMTAPALPVGWTLCFEMLFYVCAMLVLVDRRWAFILICVYGTAFTLRSIGPLFQFLGNPIILEFLLGVAIALAPGWRLGIWAIPLGAIWLAGVGLIAAPAEQTIVDLLSGQDGLKRIAIFGIPSALMVYGMLQVKLRESLWTYLGEMSYSLYLTHLFVVALLLALWMQISIPPDLIILTGILGSLLLHGAFTSSPKSRL